MIFKNKYNQILFEVFINLFLAPLKIVLTSDDGILKVEWSDQNITEAKLWYIGEFDWLETN